MPKVMSYHMPKEKGYFFLELPRGAQPRCIREEKGEIKICLLVNENATLAKKKFLQVEEGEPIEKVPPNKLIHLGAYVEKSSGRANHVFEVK